MFSEYPQRVIARVPPHAQRSFLIRLPVSTNGALDATAFSTPSEREDRLSTRAICTVTDRRGSPLPWTLVHADACEISIKVCGGPQWSSPHVVVYYDPTSDALPIASGHATCVDETPFSVTAYRQHPPAVPESWDQMLYLYHGQRDAVRVFALDRLDDPSAFQRAGARERAEEERRHFQGRSWCLHVRTVLLCPSGGVYRFAIDSADAAFLALRHELVAAWPGEHPPGAWRLGPPTLLPAGPHRLDVYVCAVRAPQIRLGWQLPGSDTIEPIPRERFVASAEAEHQRPERQHRTLHAYFTYQPQPGYTFRGTREVFLPVHLRQASANWLSEELITRWILDGGDVREGASCLHVFLGRGLHRARIEVRDGLGFSDACERILDLRMVPVREYAVAATLGELPPVCFEDDRSNPVLCVNGQGPDTAAIEVVWAIETLRGRLLRIRETLPQVAGPAFLRLGPLDMAATRRLTWHLEHLGVRLQSETIEFLRPPFARLPARLIGDRLYDEAGVRLVLVSSRRPAGWQQSALTSDALQHSWVCLDDFLDVPSPPPVGSAAPFSALLSHLLEGPTRPTVRHVPLPPPDTFPGGYAPLVKLVDPLRTLAGPPRLLVVSLGRWDLISRVTPEQFERIAAALADLLGPTLGHRMIWVTPPPWIDGEETVRSYAAAVQRIADARGLPVADLFTAVQGLGQMRGRMVSQDGRLLPAGRHLAARLVAQTLAHP